MPPRTGKRPTTSVKMVVVGDSGCGKTSLLTTATKDEFPSEYVPTVFEGWVQDVDCDETQVEVAIWDTAARNGEYDRIRPLSYPDCDVAVIVFGIDSPESLRNVAEKWAPEVRQYCPEVPIVVVGNKKELRSDAETIAAPQKTDQEAVSTEQGRVVAKQIGAYAYLECSAKTKEGVAEFFPTVARAALKPKGRKCIAL